jgi:hypothetical protein
MERRADRGSGRMTDIVAPAAVARDPAALVPYLLTAAGDEGTGWETLDVVPIERIEPIGGDVAMRGTGARFDVTARWKRLPAHAPTGWDVELEISLRADAPATGASIAVAVRIPADEDPDWLVPAVFYRENRPADSRARYPRWVADAGSSDDPFAASEWWLRSDRTSIPAVVATGGGRRTALATRSLSPLGPTGVGFGTVLDPTSPGRGARELRLSFPFREEPVVYDGSAEPLPPDRPTHAWQPGERATLAIRVHEVPSGPDASTTILHDLRAWLDRGAPIRPPVTADEAATLAADCLLTWHFRPDPPRLIETAAFARGGDGRAIEPGDRDAMHVAWLSGAPCAAALLAHGLRAGRADAVEAGSAVLDAIATNLAPCGTVWGQWTARDGWTKGWTPGPDALHARTTAEATVFLLRAAALRPDRRIWRVAAESNLRFISGVQRDDGAIPSAWNGRTGDPLDWRGDPGLAWVPAFVAGARNAEPDLAKARLDAARRAGEHYAPDVERGFLVGAPEDVHLGPTSEDGYVAVMAYVALARAEEEPSRRARWIALARRAADWTLTFRWAYDVAFPRDTPLGAIGFRTRGADLASPANQHLHAYGLICTSELLQLGRLTGEATYADHARDTFACFRQTIIRRDGDLGGRRGMTPERYYQTRYDGAPGEIGPLSHAWCLGLLLGAAELAATNPELTRDD